MDYDKIKWEIELTSCPIHNQNAVMIIKSEDQLQIKTCCKDFQDQSVNLMQELIAQQIQDDIMRSFNGL